MKNGKHLRLARFSYPRIPTGLIIPIDHGLTVGPLAGIQSVREISRWITHPAITGVIAHKGMAERLAERDLLVGKGLMIHLNGMSTLGGKPDDKVWLTSVESAVRLGADAVSLQANFDGINDAENLKALGRIVDEAGDSSLPVLAMIYDKVKADKETSIQRLRHLIRIGIELGCDAVKIGVPPDFASVFRGASEDIRIFVAGGSVVEEDVLYDLAHQTIEAGGAGLCVGRNIFQREDADRVLSQLQNILTAKNQNVTELPFPRENYGVH